MKPRRKDIRQGIATTDIHLADDQTVEQALYCVQYCARCGHQYSGVDMAMELMEDEDYGEDDDGNPLAVCRNRLACDGYLVQTAAEGIDMARDYIISGEADSRHTWESLTEAWGALEEVYGGLEIEKPRCGECFGPLPEGAEHRSVCRFCREKAADRDGGTASAPAD